jgi:hypothetical protein
MILSMHCDQLNRIFVVFAIHKNEQLQRNLHFPAICVIL